MSKLRRVILLVLSFYLYLAKAPAQSTVPPCPGFNASSNTNLACEIPTAIQSGLRTTNSLGALTPTLATQLSQLPTATAISGSGLVFSRALAVPTVSTESLGTILTQRGETLGKNKWFISVNYQRFDFSSIDGISLKHVPSVLCPECTQGASGATVVDTIQQTRIDLLVNQFVVTGSYGLTKHLDITVLVPFSQVILKTGAVSGTSLLAVPGQVPISVPAPFLAGSATGINDVSAGFKINVLDGEHSKIALGSEVRFPTGDEANFLGTGAYGIKPYIVFSRSGRLTPNINLAYQWNGSSVLSLNPNTGAEQNLPSSFLYSGGVDFRAFPKLTLTAEFIGQAVINGPRLALTTAPTPAGSFPSLINQSASYAMDNLGAGFKYSPFRGLLISANALVALDEGGLRSKVVPLVGISYRH